MKTVPPGHSSRARRVGVVGGEVLRLRGLSRQALLLVWAGVSLGFLAVIAGAELGVRGTLIFDDYASALAPALAALACFRARCAVDHRSGRAWLLLGLSGLSWSAGGIAWTVYEVYADRAVPFPSLADAGYLLSVPLAIAALLTFPGIPVHGAARLRPVLDGVIVAGALLFVSWTTVLGPAVHAATGSLFTRVISLAYPISDVLVATVALLTLARASSRQRPTMVLITLGLLVTAVADSLFSWFTAHAAYTTGNLLDAGYFAGFLLIAVAAAGDARSPRRGTDASVTGDVNAGSAEMVDVAATGPTSRMALCLLYLPLLISVPWTVVLQIRDQQIGPFATYINLAIIVAVLVRQLLTVQVVVALSRQSHDLVAELRDREVRLMFQAFHDPLTGLANRTLFADRITHALARTRRPGPVIVLLADLDDFKIVNDTLGHQAGDALLVAVSERLQAVVRPDDTVARLGGDEFAVLLDTASTVAEARIVAARIGDALLRPFHPAGVATVIGVSIGIAAADEGVTGDALLRDADIAMYAAKAAGKGRFTVFEVELANANVDRMQLKSDLGDALRLGQLSLKYQPIVDLGTGHVFGVEALLRWNHPTQGEIEPDTFIPLAEASGAIMPIGRWVVEQAIAQAARWDRARPAGCPPVSLAVNISGHQLSDPLLGSTVGEALATARLDPALLTLEITESVLLDEVVAMAPLRTLRELGVHLAIDDFGTGHSALSRLRRYPIDTLKIDRSFVAVLTPDAPVPDVIITAILTLGHGLGMDVIAEGVENSHQLDALRSLGCPKAQGFLFARPADADVITELVQLGLALVDRADTPVQPVGFETARSDLVDPAPSYPVHRVGS